MNEQSSAPDKPNAKHALAARHFLDREQIKEWEKIAPWKTVQATFEEWGLIALAMASFVLIDSWLLYPLVLCFIGGRQHALGVLMHDGSHYRLFRNRRLNDLWSDLFFAYPAFFSTQLYREEHLLHHAHLNTRKDPYYENFMAKPKLWDFPKSRLGFVGFLLGGAPGPLVGEFPWFVLGSVDQLRRAFRDRSLKPAWRPLGFFGFYLALATTITVAQLWVPFLLLWIAPTVWFGVVGRLREVVEHFPLTHLDPLQMSRSSGLRLWERAFIVSRGVSFHIEHHLYPKVPYHRLPALHGALMDNEDYRSRAEVTTSYWRGIQKLIHQQPQ